MTPQSELVGHEQKSFGSFAITNITLKGSGGMLTLAISYQRDLMGIFMTTYLPTIFLNMLSQCTHYYGDTSRVALCHRHGRYICVNLWSQNFRSGTRSAIFGHLKMGTFGKSAHFCVQKNGTSSAQIKKRRPLLQVQYPPKWWNRHLF